MSSYMRVRDDSFVGSDRHLRATNRPTDTGYCLLASEKCAAPTHHSGVGVVKVGESSLRADDLLMAARSRGVITAGVFFHGRRRGSVPEERERLVEGTLVH